MQGSFRIGRLFGINLAIDWSWVFIFLLITWNLTVAFAHTHPWGLGFSFAIALLAALLFFATVLAHELAHSLVAKAQGIDVRGITLFLFGGVSNFEREPQSPHVELTTAVVGPIMSFVIGMACLMLSSIGINGEAAVSDPARFLSALPPSSTLLLWLGSINLFVGIFNLVPAFPLDGGRVLRAILWSVTKDLRKATKWSVVVSSGVAWVLIATGIAMSFGARVPIFGRGLVGGLWLAFIGWFLYRAALQSLAGVMVREALEGVSVGRLMRRDVPVIDADTPVSMVVERLLAGDERALPVLRGLELVGMAGADTVRHVPKQAWETTPIGSVVAAPQAVASPRDDLADKFPQLARADVEAVPVVDRGNLVGVLRLRDVARWLEIRGDFEPRRHRRSLA